MTIILNPYEENYDEQYKIQLCNTLETKHEIRDCLISKSKEYDHNKNIEGFLLVFVIAIAFLFFGFFIYKQFKGD